VATLGGPTLEQQIRLDAVMVDGRLAARSLVTTRTGAIAVALVAQPITDIPQLLSRLFPLCGMAHAVAGLTAIENALAVEASPAQRALRETMLLAEHGAALGWRMLMDWPLLIGVNPDVRACADLRRAVAALSAIAQPGQWMIIGGTRKHLDRADLSRPLSALVRNLTGLFPEAAGARSWSNLESSIRRGASTPARLIGAARAGAMADYGSHNRPMLAPKPADWFAARLAADAGFSNAPTFDGVPAEVGPLAAQRHPLIADAVSHWGKTLATRLLACALDAQVVAERLSHAFDGLADDDSSAVDMTRAGCGAGVVETARGPLAYVVEVADGRVAMLRSVAPTEWNFHTDGPFMTALAAAPRVSDPVAAARLLAASFDPCVPFIVDVAGGQRASLNAELALHA